MSKKTESQNRTPPADSAPKGEGSVRSSASTLVMRLKRDCGISWPGGRLNVRLASARGRKTHGQDPLFKLETVDGGPCPLITSHYPLTYLLRHGFRVVRYPEGIVLYPAGLELSAIPANPVFPE